MDGFTLIMFSFAGPHVRFTCRTRFHIQCYLCPALLTSPPGIGLFHPLIDADFADMLSVRPRLAPGPHIVLIKPEQGIAGELITQAAMLEAPAAGAPPENTVL